ncbi:Gfo/Idh/MocA family protein [Ruixingdingia sedimenti]|uniref:Gfo/Idh/MocA family oxidoreductase n=1 Tax=Ruixingdingia sedimenti TaxID=3073604 RepID=A0ABU1FAC6_9RHOB|nr:Gfo/Idh/MocA family oxidoreductase [Xinfangfangia sp. LG-4]MDR5653815.1 Gfo/Idh/MocA family oxidoreductase [Xinfangfangia sp. LG-4]
MEPIRVGLIGASVDPARSWGTRAHVPALQHLPEYELAALCTTREETARAAAAAFGVPHAFWDARAMTASTAVDLVAIAVRTPLHGEMVQAALAAGKAVYCEWPLGATVEEARRTLADTQAAGVVNMIGLQGRQNEAIRYARDLIAEGYVGRIVSVTMKVTQANFGPDETPGNAYTADAANGATILTIAAGQALEAMCHAVGGLRRFSAVVSNQHPVARIAPTGEEIAKTAPDQVLIAGLLDGGAVVSVHIRGGAAPATSYARLEINGTAGDLVLSAPGAANLHRVALSVSGARRGEPVLRPLPVPASYGIGIPEGPARYLGHNYVELARALRGGPPVTADFAHALRWQEMLAAIQRASDTGQAQEFTAVT